MGKFRASGRVRIIVPDVYRAALFPEPVECALLDVYATIWCYLASLQEHFRQRHTTEHRPQHGHVTPEFRAEFVGFSAKNPIPSAVHHPGKWKGLRDACDA